MSTEWLMQMVRRCDSQVLCMSYIYTHTRTLICICTSSKLRRFFPSSRFIQCSVAGLGRCPNKIAGDNMRTKLFAYVIWWKHVQWIPSTNFKHVPDCQRHLLLVFTNCIVVLTWTNLTTSRKNTERVRMISIVQRSIQVKCYTHRDGWGKIWQVHTVSATSHVPLHKAYFVQVICFTSVF